MVICRYFLQGTCKFGSNCRYEHSYREYENEGPPANSYRRTYGGQYHDTGSRYTNAPQNPAVPNIRELMQVVINELNQSERGGQWPLSCFAPIKEKPCYPGLDDYSPEEIRWQMYEAVKSGTVEDCKRRIQQLQETYKLKKNTILHPTAETYATVEKLFKGEIPVTSFAPVSAAPPTNFSFNISNHGGERRATPNLFGGGTTAVGGGNNVSTQNLFGGSGENVQQRNVFNVTPQTVPTANVFGNKQTSGASPLYGGAVGGSNVFRVDAGTVNNNNFFANNSQQMSFDKSVSQPSAGFTQKAAQIGSVSSVQSDNVYTTLNDLVESERNSFSAQTFTMGHIPKRPPPKEFCV